VTPDERVAAFGQAWRRGDVDAILAHMTEDAVYSTSVGPEPGRTFVGREELARGIAGALEAHSHLVFHPGEAWTCGQRGVAHWHYTVRGDDSDVVTARGVDILAFRDGLVARKDAFRKTA
jgi:ketosteroid isomerase-like protein